MAMDGDADDLDTLSNRPTLHVFQTTDSNLQYNSKTIDDGDEVTRHAAPA